jgi:hypothetical protein
VQWLHVKWPYNVNSQVLCFCKRSWSFCHGLTLIWYHIPFCLSLKTCSIKHLIDILIFTNKISHRSFTNTKVTYVLYEVKPLWSFKSEISSHHLNHFILVKNYVIMGSLCNHHVSLLVEIIHYYKKNRFLFWCCYWIGYRKICIYVSRFIGCYDVSKLVALK